MRYRLNIYRTDVVVDAGAYGRYRILLIMAWRGCSVRFFQGIENADDPDKIPTGTHILVMTTMATARLKAIWLPGTQLFGHVANYARQLKGCFSIGRLVPSGVLSSRSTWDALFKWLDGHAEGKEIHVTVTEMGDQDG